LKIKLAKDQAEEAIRE